MLVPEVFWWMILKEYLLKLTIADNQLIIAMSGQDLTNQELKELVLQQRKELAGTRKELDEFRAFVRDKMVPLEERVFAPKRLSHREREVEVERATRPYRTPGDKRTVGFLADLRIDIRERQEAIKDLNSCHEVDDDGNFGDLDWEPEENRAKFSAFC